VYTVYIHVYCTLMHFVQNTASAAADSHLNRTVANEYVHQPGGPLPASSVVASGRKLSLTGGDDEDDEFDPYASLGNLHPTDLIQFAWQIACGMVRMILTTRECKTQEKKKLISIVLID